MELKELLADVDALVRRPGLEGQFITLKMVRTTLGVTWRDTARQRNPKDYTQIQITKAKLRRPTASAEEPIKKRLYSNHMQSQRPLVQIDSAAFV